MYNSASPKAYTLGTETTACSSVELKV